MINTLLNKKNKENDKKVLTIKLKGGTIILSIEKEGND